MKKQIRYILFAAVVCSYLLMSGVSVKAEQTMAMKNAINSKNLVLLGTALKKFLAFRVVTVDLFIERGYGADDVFSDVSKRLEVNYHVNIPKHELDRATIKGIEKNYSQDQMVELMPQIDQINSYYPDIKSGDQIAVTYVPGVGSQVELNGELKGVVFGSDFAKAFFSIWLGDNPVDKNAKLKLLGLKD